ncbi:hypothetical protein ABQX22_09075 [Xanthomonas sp. WHRI 1810A]|uniref:hypothetical protein n=1 Tax=Xanthomonas sp. WHRI 1810A TaxID=3161565 RepID=UPI0032E87D3D
MRVDQTSVTHTTSSIPASGPAKTEEVRDAPMQPSTAASTLSISGQTLLRQRLFFSAPDAEPPIVRDRALMNGFTPDAYFLTLDDRQLLGDVYEFAQAKGIDLVYADRLGHSLADYRNSDDGKIMLPHNRGMEYDLEGHRRSYSFTDANAAIAKRIRESPSLPTTRLDRGFIAFQTDQDYSVLSHTPFGFLELVVNKFSASTEPLNIDESFKQNHYVKHDFVEHLSKEVYDVGVSKKGKGAAQRVDGKGERSTGAVPLDDLQTALRKIMAKYLEKSGLPSLFETIARLRR